MRRDGALQGQPVRPHDADIVLSMFDDVVDYLIQVDYLI